jgi:dCTP deaminase
VPNIVTGAHDRFDQLDERFDRAERSPGLNRRSVHPVVAGAAARLQRMVLSDATIRQRIEAGGLLVEPYDHLSLQPSSLDVRLDRHFRVFQNTRRAYIDIRENSEDVTEPVSIAAGEPFILHPSEFVLGQTLERFTLPTDLVGRLEGKSSLGRLGLLIHSTAGFVDPGFSGHLTLELSNVSNLPIMLLYGIPIGQISFLQMDRAAETPYGSPKVRSKYQGQDLPTASRYHLNFPDGDPADQCRGRCDRL